MKIGVCTSIDRLDLLENLGYDQIELNIGAISQMNEKELPNLKLLVDLYHFYCGGEPLDRIYEYGSYIKHVHIVEPTHRTFMRPGDEYDYKAFLKALRDVGYDGALMFEGGGDDHDAGIAGTYPVLRTLSEEASI